MFDLGRNGNRGVQNTHRVRPRNHLRREIGGGPVRGRWTQKTGAPDRGDRYQAQPGEFVSNRKKQAKEEVI